MSDIAVIGGGAWGTAIANSLCKNNNNVKLWCFEKEVAEEINENHTNSRYLYGVWLNSDIKASDNLKEVVNGSEYVFYVTPSFVLQNIVKESKDYLSNDVIPVFLTKGFIDVNKALPQLPLSIADEILPAKLKGNSVFLSGPSHAEEVARSVYTGLIASSLNKKNAIKVRDICGNEFLSVFVSFDPIGVQVSAALKNIVAIAFGFADALSEYDKNIGDNTFAMVISTGLNEIQRLAMSMGSTHPETFTSYSAVGDLFVTCTSHHGRNRRFGRDLLERQLYRQWENFDDLLTKINLIGYLPEGIFAVKPAMTLKEHYNLKLPIIEHVYAILNRDIKPRDVVKSLMKAFIKND
jgi:glycerol-3-phosphate dehydrogenase (NAD(P)+)